MSSEQVCYVHCHFCNTILAVSVPCSSTMMMNTVTVRCGHCSNLLSVNVGGALLQSLPIQQFQKQSTITHEATNGNNKYNNYGSSSSSSIPSKMNKFGAFHSAAHPHLRMSPIRPYAAPEKRQRVPSAYNRFIKEEIQRIKSSNPKMSHREAFSTAAKNWAHFPHMHFGLNLEGNKQAK